MYPLFWGVGGKKHNEKELEAVHHEFFSDIKPHQLQTRYKAATIFTVHI